MLYRVTLYKPTSAQTYKTTSSCLVGTLRSAELCAKDWLPVVYETEYSARVNRHPFVKVESVKHKRTLEIETYHYTPVCYVPSVGDLGYSP